MLDKNEGCWCSLVWVNCHFMPKKVYANAGLMLMSVSGELGYGLVGQVACCLNQPHKLNITVNQQETQGNITTWPFSLSSNII